MPRRVLPQPPPITPVLAAEIVGLVYEAAADPGLWPVLAERLLDLYPEAQLVLSSYAGGTLSADMNLRTNFSDAAARDYVHYVSNSPYVDFVPRNGIGVPVRSEAIIGEAELFRTEHYNDFMRPHGIGHHGTGMVLEREPGRWAALSITDLKDDAARRDHQMALLALLAPHFRRALKLRQRLAEMRDSAAAPMAMFHGWSQAALVLGDDGRVVSMNRRAEALVAAGDGFGLTRFGQPHGIDDRASRALECAVAECRTIRNRAIGGETDGTGVMLPRRAGSPLHAMLWPVASGAEFDLPAPMARILLIVSDPDDTPPGAVAWIARRFGLSPAEEKLADAVIAGVPLAESAERLGIQLSTARTRLKAIQAKTGCRRQLDLVRLAMSVPPVRIR